MAPCWPILTLISVLSNLSSKSKFLSSIFYLLLAELFFENLVLGNQILDGWLLLPVEPSGQGKENQLPGMEDQLHSAPDAENNAPSIFGTR